MLVQDSIAARAASRIRSLIRDKPEASEFFSADGMALHRFHDVQGGRIPSRPSRKLDLEYQIGRPLLSGKHLRRSGRRDTRVKGRYNETETLPIFPSPGPSSTVEPCE